MARSKRRRGKLKRSASKNTRSTRSVRKKKEGAFKRILKEQMREWLNWLKIKPDL